MPRMARKNLETYYYHVIVQGINKEYIFEKKSLKETYIDILKRNISDKKIEFISYCIMDNHAHMLIYTEDIDYLKKFMQKCNTSYAKLYNKANNRVGYVFRDRYFTQMILNQKQLYNCIAYIHYNPVKANIVKTLKDYKYSSYQEYIGKTEKLITKDGITLAFGSANDYQDIFKEIHCKKDIEDIADVNEVILTGEQIINNYIYEKNKSIDEIVCNPNEFCELLLQLRHKGNLSLRDMSKIFNINKDKLNKIINLKM